MNSFWNDIGPVTLLIVLFMIGILIFLILREFWCWYWKINKRTVLLESIERKLSMLTNTDSILDTVEDPSETLPNLSAPIGHEEKETHVCSYCSKETTENLYYCPTCEKYFCYSCIKAGAKCPVCNTRLIR
jgi:hypothetical protein